MLLAGYMVPHPPIAVPEIGRGEERKIQDTLNSFAEVARDIAEKRPETIILISPHAVMYRDYFHISPGSGAKGNFGQFGAGQVRFSVSCDQPLAERIASEADKNGFPAGMLGERDRNLDHGTMVPLYFIDREYTDYRLIRIGLSGLSLEDHWRFGRMIRKAVDESGRRCVLVASGDLSHCQKEDGPYGYRPEGPAYDRQIMEVMGSGDFRRLLEFPEDFLDRSMECGHRSFAILGGAFDGSSVSSKSLSHEAVFGVGYGFCIYHPKGGEKMDPYVQLARNTIDLYIRGGEVYRPEDGELTEEMRASQAGAFVSIHENGELRGCIGTIAPTRDTLAEEIISNAISAAVRDPRFPAIREEELDMLEISVDVLGKPELIQSKDELYVKRYGVIVEKGYRRGLLLPDLEGVDTVDYQIYIAKRKAGIYEDERDVRMYRFEVIRHE